MNHKDEQYIKAFDMLRNSLTSDQILSYPDFNVPFILTSDASNFALGALLSQMQDGNERPIAFASPTLNKAKINYSTTEKEALAFIWAVNKYYPNLYGNKFILLIGHKPLTFINTSTKNFKILRWRLELENFDYEIKYKEGKTNVVADALSRKDLENINQNCLFQRSKKKGLKGRNPKEEQCTMDINVNENLSISDSQINNPPESQMDDP